MMEKIKKWWRGLPCWLQIVLVALVVGFTLGVALPFVKRLLPPIPPVEKRKADLAQRFRESKRLSRRYLKRAFAERDRAERISKEIKTLERQAKHNAAKIDDCDSFDCVDALLDEATTSRIKRPTIRPPVPPTSGRGD